MVRQNLLFCVMAATVSCFVFVIPMQTAPVHVKKPVKEIVNSIGMKLVRIPAGKFKMGSPTDEKERGDDEHLHEVEITKPFYMGIYTVTQAQYKRVMGSNPSWFSLDGNGYLEVIGTDTSSFPVETVDWHHAKKFCEKLMALVKEKEEKRVYRLPTEAEWEYACRVGTNSRYYSGDGEKDLKKVAWYCGNSKTGAHTVGRKKANPWGLYDMHGNVDQWCSDWYAKDYRGKSPLKDPQGPKIGEFRIQRGGSWSSGVKGCRAANRSSGKPDERIFTCGFRVVCIPVGE